MGLQTELKFFHRLKDPRDAGINIGWFADQRYAKDRKGRDVSIADVARWNEFGTRQGLPQRPFLRTCIMENEKKWHELLKTVVQRAIDENKSFTQALKTFGSQVRGDIQDTILDGGWQPNATISIYGGWMRNKISGKPFYVEGKGTGKPPLINTGTLLKSIDIRTDEEMGNV